MKKITASFLIFCCLFANSVSALSNENITNYTLKYEKIFSTKYDFSKLDKDLLNTVIGKIDNYVSQIYSNKLKYDSVNAENILGQLLGLKKNLQKYTVNADTSNLNITVIDDKRCTNCGTDKIMENLKNTLYFKGASFKRKDFSDIGVSDFLKSNFIKLLPIVILSNDKFTDNISILSNLKKLNDGSFLYDIGGSFDPFKVVSDRGYFKIDSETFNQLKSGAHLNGNLDANITWLVYSDLACTYCQKFHNSNFLENLKMSYGDNLNHYFLHYITNLYPTSQLAAELLECFAEQKGATGFYDLLSRIYKDGKSDEEFIINTAVSMGANKTELENCYNNGTYKAKIENQVNIGKTFFGIYGTPTNVFINNKTGEFIVLAGNYTFSEIKNMINNLIK